MTLDREPSLQKSHQIIPPPTPSNTVPYDMRMPLKKSKTGQLTLMLPLLNTILRQKRCSSHLSLILCPFRREATSSSYLVRQLLVHPSLENIILVVFFSVFE